MPLREAAREMRDVYANEIARAVHAGQEPDPFAVVSWAKYEAEATSGEPPRT
ncbi:hypothetical protein [Frondihabitans sp. PAMC 28766]|uniref:hypothetical protein n=1 Tax=Frondihabitans sp. PAMC 28766 TaxID=1795630 RepID=UPI0012FF78B4|nr:hypothetical protein [Frondihabitans sp. PAMC 28766]